MFTLILIFIVTSCNNEQTSEEPVFTLSQFQPPSEDIAKYGVMYPDSEFEYIDSDEAKNLFKKLLHNLNPVIHIMMFTNLSNEWMEKSVNADNWFVKEGFKQIRADGKVDYDFTVHPKPSLLGFDVLIPSESITLRDEMFDRDYYLFFNGEKPKCDVFDKDLVALKIDGSFLPTGIIGDDKEMKEYSIKVLERKSRTDEERNSFLNKLKVRVDALSMESQ